MSLYSLVYSQSGDTSSGNMSSHDISIQLSALQSEYEEKHDAIRIKEYRHIPEVFRSSYKENALNNLEKSTFEKAKSIIRNAGKYVSEATEWNIQHDRRQGKSWYDAVLSAYDAALSQELANNPPEPPKPPKPKEREKREITERDISREIDSYKAEYPDDEIDRQTAIQRIINIGRERGIDYILPLPKQAINPFKRRSEIRLTPNTRLEGIDLQLYVKSMLTMIYGDTNSGKSTLGLHTSVQIAVTNRKTWLISTEDSLDIVRERVEVMRSEYSAEQQQLIDDNLMYSSMDTIAEYAEDNGYDSFSFDLMDNDTGEVINQIVEEYEIDTIILDTLSGATVLSDEINNAQMNRALQPLISLSNRGVRVIFIHHTKGKGDTPRTDKEREKAYSGAGTILRRVTDAFYLQAVGSNQITLYNTKAKATAKGGYQTFAISNKSTDVIDDNGDTITSNGRIMKLSDKAVVTEAVKTGTNKQRILAYLTTVDSARNEDIVKELEMLKGNVSRDVGQLITSGSVIENEDGSFSAVIN